MADQEDVVPQSRQQYEEAVMRTMMLMTLLFFALLLIPQLTLGTTFDIHPDGTGDFPTIQAGVDAAIDGDVLLLANGVFAGPGNWDVDFSGKDITIASASGDRDLCTIDCFDGDMPHRGFLFQSGEGPSARLESITVYRGVAREPDFHGGGVYIVNFSSPSIVNCVFRQCIAPVDPDMPNGSGGGIYCGSSMFDGYAITDCLFESNLAVLGGGLACVAGTVSMERCRFVDNTGQDPIGGGRGGAVYCVDGALGCSQCEFVDNTAQGNSNARGGGVYLAVPANHFFYSCLFADNNGDAAGGGVYIGGGSDVAFVGCVFYGNYTSVQHAEGGGMHIVQGAEVHVTQCTFSQNSSEYGGGVFCDGFCSVNRTILWDNIGSYQNGELHAAANGFVTYQCSDFNMAEVGGPGAINDDGDNIDADPQFCDPGVQDFTIADSSPCAPANSPCGTLIGALDAACTTTAVEERSWGQVKALFRR